MGIHIKKRMKRRYQIGSASRGSWFLKKKSDGGKNTSTCHPREKRRPEKNLLRISSKRGQKRGKGKTQQLRNEKGRKKEVKANDHCREGTQWANPALEGKTQSIQVKRKGP